MSPLPEFSSGGVASFISTTSKAPGVGAPQSSPLIKANFYIRADLHRELKHYALDNDLKIYEVLERALEHLFNRGKSRRRRVAGWVRFLGQ